MRRIEIKLKEKSYRIIIGNRIINSLGSLLNKLNIGKDAIIITNPLIKKYFGKKVEKSLAESNFTVKFLLTADTEKSKSTQAVFNLINSIAKYDIRKKMFIIALGGGVIGDLAGFIAAVYKRGIPYIQVPTTLLGQVDSAIGGKTAIDLRYAKNLVGAFYQPRLVISDISTLKSLNKRQIKSGLAEVVKYGIIKDRNLFEYIEKNIKKILSLDKRYLEHIIYKCSLIKTLVVQQDEKEEKGIRTILNFGHTIGHAIEAAGKYHFYNHGEAIAVGMICASQISERLGLLSKKSGIRIESLISKIGLPTKIRGIKLLDILSAHLHDKKFTSKRNRFVLPTTIGKVTIHEDVPLKIIKSVLKEKIAER